MGMHLVHSGPVVTHRSASGAQPAGQQVCANAGGISAYAKTRITSLRYPMPFPSLTPIGGREIGSRAKPTRSGRRNRRAQDKRPDHCQAARSRGTDRTYAITQLPAPTGFKPMAVESFPAASPDTKKKRPRHGLTSSYDNGPRTQAFPINDHLVGALAGGVGDTGLTTP